MGFWGLLDGQNLLSVTKVICRRSHGKLGFLKFPCFHILPDCEDCFPGRVYVISRGANIHFLTILRQFRYWKHFPSLISNFSWGCTDPTTPDPPAAFGMNHYCLLMPHFTQILPNIQ